MMDMLSCRMVFVPWVLAFCNVVPVAAAEPSPSNASIRLAQLGEEVRVLKLRVGELEKKDNGLKPVAGSEPRSPSMPHDQPLIGSPTITASSARAGGGVLADQRQPRPNRSGWPFETNAEIFSQPCFDERCMCFGCCDGVFYCLDKKSGAVRWKKEGLYPYYSNPAIYRGAVYFADGTDTIYALKSSSGEVQWKAAFPGIGYRRPKLLNGMVHVLGREELLGLDPDNGKVVRRYTLPGDGRDFTWNSNAIVVAVNKHVDNDDTREASVVCYAYDKAKPRWRTALGAARLWCLACDEDRCYQGASDGFFYAIDISDGRIAWRIDCQTLFVGNGSRNKRALRAEVGHAWADGGILVAGKNVVFSARRQIDSLSVLAMVHKKTGSLIWAAPHPQAIQGCFVVADGLSAAIAADRRMLLVRIADGKSVAFSPIPAVLGKTSTNGEPRGEFAGIFLDDGQLFILGADSNVWRLPFASVKGALDWPIAHSHTNSRQEEPSSETIDHRSQLPSTMAPIRLPSDDYPPPVPRNYGLYVFPGTYGKTGAGVTPGENSSEHR
jgi:outer membrane protein assembly factor BamB